MGTDVGQLSYVLLLAAALGLASPAAPASAAQRSASDAVVYIECHDPADPNSSTTHGTGIVVKDDGTVLTASHVAPVGWVCAGSVGTAEPDNLKKLIRSPSVAAVDAALLRFAAQAKYQYIGYCELEDWMIRRPIIVAGFPGRTETGAVSYRQGVLATTLTDSKGVFETDGQAVAGMGGGPVLSTNLAGFVGMVLGSHFDLNGEASYRAVLSAEQIALDLDLEKAAKPCFHEKPFVDFLDIVVTPERHALEVSADEAACFLSGVRGFQGGDDDWVRVSADGDDYYVEGSSEGAAHLSVDVRCLWYE